MIISVSNGKILIRKVYKTDVLRFENGKERIINNGATMVAYTHFCYEGVWNNESNNSIPNSNKASMTVHIDNFLHGICRNNIQFRLKLLKLIEKT